MRAGAPGSFRRSFSSIQYEDDDGWVDVRAKRAPTTMMMVTIGDDGMMMIRTGRKEGYETPGSGYCRRQTNMTGR